jgi:hypothetical protein
MDPSTDISRTSSRPYFSRHVQPRMQHTHEQGKTAMSGATSSTIPRLNLLPDFPGRGLAYHPLNSLAGEVRVIVLLHAAEREAPLRCFLKTISIHEGRSTEPYNAISYYWGSTENLETVEVYGGSWGYHQFGGSFKIPITSNLALALREFRTHATAERQRLVLWTDALCINQTDPDERSEQVRIMRDIYKAAHGVWMWIGGTSPTAETGLHNLYCCRKNIVRSEIFTEVCPNARLDEMVALQVHAAGGIKRRLKRLYLQNILEFVRETYWRRGWVIQEATANSDTYMCYGPARYRIRSWSKFNELMSALRDGKPRTERVYMEFHIQTNLLQHCQEAWEGKIGTLTADIAKQLRVGKSGRPAKWYRLFETSRQRHWLLSLSRANCWHTSDPRDRVHAIMCAMPSYYTLDFQPDYSKSTEDVFISATVHLLSTGRSWSSPQFLAPSGSPYLPSWTIDFTAARPLGDSGDFNVFTPARKLYSTDPFFPFVRLFDPHHNTDRSKFRADARTRFRLRQITRGVLKIAGLVVDKVVSVSSTINTTPGCTCDNDVLRAWYRLLSQNKRYTRRNTTLSGRARKWEAFCRTMCAGRVGDLKFDASHHASASEAVWDGIIYDRQGGLEDMHGEAAEELYRNMRHALVGARLIVTRRGRIGVAPWGVAAGDSIGILAGGDVPFVLRNVKAEDVPGDAHILIGGCYIDGKTGGCFLLHNKHS